MFESFFIVQILHTLNQFSCSSLNTFKQLCPYCNEGIDRAPYLAAIFQLVRSHHSPDCFFLSAVVHKISLHNWNSHARKLTLRQNRITQRKATAEVAHRRSLHRSRSFKVCIFDANWKPAYATLFQLLQSICQITALTKRYLCLNALVLGNLFEYRHKSYTAKK